MPLSDEQIEMSAGATSATVRIGLINNMPDAALKATERQFRNLILSAAEGIDVQLLLFALPEVRRAGWAQHYLNSRYLCATELPGTTLDGIIVTGAEPRAASLPEEPYWGSLTKVIDWAGRNTRSAIWSCLAAHAVVQHCDGIERQRLAQKRFGVFECVPVANDPMMAGTGASFYVPHSRWNDIPEQDLIGAGYRILSRDTAGHVDAFVKRGTSLFLFFQGHPEYEPDTLLLEQKRDAARYPEAAIEQNPLRSHPESVEWTSLAVGIYRNWVRYLMEQKEPRQSREALAQVASCGQP